MSNFVSFKDINIFITNTNINIPNLVIVLISKYNLNIEEDNIYIKNVIKNKFNINIKNIKSIEHIITINETVSFYIVYNIYKNFYICMYNYKKLNTVLPKKLFYAENLLQDFVTNIINMLYICINNANILSIKLNNDVHIVFDLVEIFATFNLLTTYNVGDVISLFMRAIKNFNSDITENFLLLPVNRRL